MKSIHARACLARASAAAMGRMSAFSESLEGRVLFDTTAPVASLDLTQPPPAGFGDPGIIFNVTFFDDVAVAGASLGDDDFRVMGPNGYNQLAHYIPNAPPTAPMVHAQYSFPAPAGG